MKTIAIKRPRRPHVFRTRLTQDMCHGDHICAACMEGFAAEAEYNRPGHVWTIIDGKVVYQEDAIAGSVLGRPLNSNEGAIHKDGNPLNNTRANIEIVTISDMESK